MKTKIFLLIMGILFFVSCSEDFITRDLDKSRYVPSTYYNTKENADQALVAVYSGIRAAYSGNQLIMGLVLGDDLYQTGFAAGWTPWGNTAMLDIQNTHGNVSGIWNGFYSYILYANTALTNMKIVQEKDAAFTKAQLDVMEGQVYALRGFYYSQLYEFFPDDAIVLRDEMPTDFYFAPSSSEETFAFIENDLKNAQSLLANCLNTTSSYEKWRVSRGAVTAMLGNLYMHKKDYVKAAAEFKRLLPDVGDPAYGSYALGDYRANFTEAGENNSESIFEVQYADVASPSQRGGQLQSWTLNRVTWADMWWNLAAPTYRLDEFESWTETIDGAPTTVYDYRVYETLWGVPNGANFTENGVVKDWIAQGWNTEIVGGEGSTGAYGIRKRSYDSNANLPGNSPTSTTINVRVIRLADVMLLYAECLAKNNPGNVSVTDPESGAYWVQKVRDRANLPMNDQAHLYSARPGVNGQLPVVTDLMASKGWTLMQAIEHERYVEGYCEGWRGVDLKRWEKGADFVLKNKPLWTGWQSLILPVPLTELQNNPDNW